MDEDILPKVAPSRRSLSRRDAMGRLTGAVTGALLAGRGSVRADGAPPVFRNASHQFTLMSPLKTLPSASLIKLDGSPTHLTVERGRVLLIVIWATWCPPCSTELPLLERFLEGAAGRVDVAAVSIDKADRERVWRYLEMISVHRIPIYLDPNERLTSASSESQAPLPIYGMPITYLITPSDRIAGYISGVSDWRTEDARKLLDYYASA